MEQTATKIRKQCNLELLQRLKRIIDDGDINLNFSEILHAFGFVAVELENEDSQVTLSRVEKSFDEVDNLHFF